MTMANARLTVLTENSTYQGGLRAEHGWSVWVEWGDYALLFDTGQSNLLVDNARALDVPLSRASAVVLSHGHYDHAGGLAAVAALASEARIFLHPAAMSPKYSIAPGKAARDIGLPKSARDLVESHAGRVTWVNGPMELAPGLWLSGPIPRRTNFEDVGGPFYLDAAGQTPDPLVDDMALGMSTQEGLVILLGCAHAGVVNTLDYFQTLLGPLPIHMVLGGMHLLHASPARMAATLDVLERRRVQRLGPAHCTGFAATAALWARFEGKCFLPSVGARLEFKLS